MEATAKDLRLHTRELLAATDRGEEVVITWRGRKRARLVPFEPGEAVDKAAQGRNPAFGLWRDREIEVEDWVRSAREGRTFE